MTLRILKPGLQTTVQACPRAGLRHLGVPASGAADPLSLALANRLVGNALLAPGIETTLTGVRLLFEDDGFAAITGAKAKARLNGERVKLHRTLAVAAGDELEIGPAKAGARNYLALAGGVAVDEVLGSASTYLPAGFGGFEGRALRSGDVITVGPHGKAPKMLKKLQQAVIRNENVFAVLMEAVRVCSLGQITNALFEVGGQYRRSM